MKILKFLTLLLLVLLVANCKQTKDHDNSGDHENNSTEVEEVATVQATLYERLGGAEGISAIVDDVIQTHMENPVVSAHFLPLKENEAYFESFKTHVKQFFASGTGGAEQYMGKDFAHVHDGMNITEKEFLSTIDDILIVLKKHEIDEQSQKDVLYILYSLKGMVIAQ